MAGKDFVAQQGVEVTDLYDNSACEFEIRLR